LTGRWRKAPRGNEATRSRGDEGDRSAHMRRLAPDAGNA
jgi:hypothetical protein